MKRLKGYRWTIALTISRWAAWGLVCILAVACGCQSWGLVGGGEGEPLADAQLPAGPEEPGSAELAEADIEDYAVIWERMGTPAPPPRPEPKPVVQAPVAPSPPPDPYPAMRLIATFVEDGHDYALIEVARGRTELIREGEARDDIRVTAIEAGGVTVEVPNHTKVLTMPEERH
jgi:hypothetical protein